MIGARVNHEVHRQQRQAQLDGKLGALRADQEQLAFDLRVVIAEHVSKLRVELREELRAEMRAELAQLQWQVGR